MKRPRCGEAGRFGELPAPKSWGEGVYRRATGYARDAESRVGGEHKTLPEGDPGEGSLLRATIILLQIGQVTEKRGEQKGFVKETKERGEQHLKEGLPFTSRPHLTTVALP